MAKLNDPFCALKEGRLGKVGEVLNMAKAMAITAIHEQGTALDELELRAKEQKDYHDLYGPKPSQGAAAITRRDNRAAAAAAAADIEGNLMFSEEELRAMKLKDLQALKRGWVAVGQVAFGTGAVWQAVFAKEGRGKANAEGKCCLVKEDYILDLLAAMSSYRELMQGCEQHEGDTCAPAAALVDLVPASAPVAAAAPAPARAPVPAPARDPT